MNAPCADGQDLDIAATLSAFLAGRGFKTVRVSTLQRLTGGSSHDTWAFDLTHGDEPHHETTRLVMRRNLGAASLDMSPDAEFRLLQWLHGKGIPVARPLLCAVEDSPFSAPIVISERLQGVDLRKAMGGAHARVDRAAAAATLVALQARIHAVDLKDCPCGVFAAPSVASPKGEIDRWTASLLETGEGGAGPLARAAIEWLRSHIPASGELVLVHGDFKANNILWSDAGRPYVLDWELSHLSDPVEDLAWTMLWTSKDDLVSGMMTPSNYVAAYEAASGQRVDPARLFFWQLFALVKLSAIMRSGSGTIAAKSLMSPSHALYSRGVACLDAAMADYLLATKGSAR